MAGQRRQARPARSDLARGPAGDRCDHRRDSRVCRRGDRAADRSGPPARRGSVGRAAGALGPRRRAGHGLRHRRLGEPAPSAVSRGLRRHASPGCRSGTTSERLAPADRASCSRDSRPSSSPGSSAAAGLSRGSAPTDRVEVIAHRGAAAARPENTMAAIERGIEDGADWIEIDVQETADGEVVVFHDSDFMRLAHVDRKIWEVTAAETPGHRPRQLVRPRLRRRASPHAARRAGGGQGPREGGDRAEVLRSRPGPGGARRGAGGRVRHGRSGRADVAQLSRGPEGPGDAAGSAQRRAGGDGGGRPRGPRDRFPRGQCRPRHAGADPLGPRGGEGRLCLDRQ